MARSSFVPALVAFAFAASAALAEEGMWTFDNFPAAAVQQKYGTAVDQRWLDRVRSAGVRLSSGCSASVVSPEGLVLTNHHCVSDCVQTLSTPQQDLMKTGFSPAARTDEKRCAGMQAEILTTIEDVTPRVTNAGAGKTGLDYVRSRDAEVAAIESAACSGRAATHRCQVVTLYQGGQYRLYTFRKYEDVRLAFAPEFQMAFFGGDPDNFNFPRYDLDFAFLRLYDGDRTAETPAHLRWNASAPRAGDPVFVVGNPGSTNRLMTTEQLESLRDFVLPTQQLMRSELRGRLIRFSQESPENARIAAHELFAIENTYKAIYGQVRALTDARFMAAKRRAEEDLKTRARGSAGLGDPWAEIAKAQADYAALFLPYDFVERRAGSGSQLFGYAKTLVRAAAERAKPNGQRLPEFGDVASAIDAERASGAAPGGGSAGAALPRVLAVEAAGAPDRRCARDPRHPWPGFPREPGPAARRLPPGRPGLAPAAVGRRGGRHRGVGRPDDPVRAGAGS